MMGYSYPSAALVRVDTALAADQEQGLRPDAPPHQLETFKWPELTPLPELRHHLPPPFPFDGLGPVLGPAARAIAEGVQAPDSMAAGSVLANAALAAQSVADIAMPLDLVYPLSLFLVTSASSGDRRSATDAAAGRPYVDTRKRDARNAAADRAEQERERRPGESTGKRLIHGSIIVSKATTEGLHGLLQTQPHIGLFSTEGAELIGGHSMREERKAAGIAWMLKAWSGETLDSLTKGDGLSVLIGRRVSMHILLQPVVAQSLLTDPLAQGQGWIARCLVAAPQSIAGTRLFRDDALPVSERTEVRLFHQQIEALLYVKPKLRPEGDGYELDPRRIGLAPEARALWIEFYNECERQQAPGGELAEVKPWASKAAEHAARIAGVIALAQDPGASAVSGTTMAGAIEVANFYLTEHVRLMGQSREHVRLERLHLLLSFLRQSGRLVRHAAVLQGTNRSLRGLKAEGLNDLLDELEQRGYVRKAREHWEVRP